MEPKAGAKLAHGAGDVSPWVTQWACRIPPEAPVLDVACGQGRHARWLAARGHPVDAVDRDPAAIAALSGVAGLRGLCADLEGAAWPYPGRAWGGVVVTHYLHRALFPVLIASVAPGGVLIYETFAAGNERYGRPSSPEFLLRPGELRTVVSGHLDVVAFEEGFFPEPRPAMLQRICAVRPG